MLTLAEIQGRSRTGPAQRRSQLVLTGDDATIFHYAKIWLCRLITNIRQSLYQSKLYPWTVSNLSAILETASTFESQFKE